MPVIFGSIPTEAWLSTGPNGRGPHGKSEAPA